VSQDIFSNTRLIVCVGTGGVGKTTTSASLALRAAIDGRRVLVLTIDPAKRLANAMGLDHLGNEPQPVRLEALGDAQGSLDAMMLDATRSFDDLIRRTAGAEASSILENRVYRVMADHFAGVQEYMALERLFDMYESGKWDLIVLDTPPAQNAFDFFTSPKRVAAMFDERIMRWFLPNNDKDAGFFQRVFNPGAVVLKVLSYIGGEAFIGELSEFFNAVRIVRASFQERGQRVEQILADAQTRYVVIASPDSRRVSEALDFRGRLLDLDLDIALFILNRSHHRFRPEDVDPLIERAPQIIDDSSTDERLRQTLRGSVLRATAFYRDLVALAERDRAGIAQLMTRVDRAKVRLVPIFGKDIHTLSELRLLSDFLIR